MVRPVNERKYSSDKWRFSYIRRAWPKFPYKQIFKSTPLFYSWWFKLWVIQILRNFQDYLFYRNLSLAYEKIVYWKKNLFLLPSGLAGKSFIDKISWLMNKWMHESPLKDIGFKAIMVMPSLLLQKPSRKSKSRDHLKSLENQMKLWNAGEMMELLKEGETIQKDLRVSNTPSTPLSETHLNAVKGLVWLRDFAQCVNKESLSERRNYVRAEQTDLLYANAKDLIRIGRI